MTVFNDTWYSSIVCLFVNQAQARRRNAARRRQKPWVDRLEDRTLLSTTINFSSFDSHNPTLGGFSFNGLSTSNSEQPVSGDQTVATYYSGGPSPASFNAVSPPVKIDTLTMMETQLQGAGNVSVTAYDLSGTAIDTTTLAVGNSLQTYTLNWDHVNYLTLSNEGFDISQLVWEPASGPQNQNINFTQPTSSIQFSPNEMVTLSASATSGLPVSFGIDGASTGSGSINNNVLTVTSAGSFVIDANQGGDGVSWNAASQVQQTLDVGPVLTLGSTSLNLGTTTASTAGGSQSFTVSGIDMASNLSITPPAGVELSLNNSTFQSTALTLTESGGTLNTTTVYARISGSAGQGGVTGNINLTGNYNISVAGLVNGAGTAAVVTNLSDTSSVTDEPIGNPGYSDLKSSESFQTGTSDLTVSAVTVALDATTGSPTQPLVLGIYTDTTGAGYNNSDTTESTVHQPGTLVATLTPPSSPSPFIPTAAGDYTFTSASGVTLSAGTTYWIVLSTTNSASNVYYNWLYDNNNTTPTTQAGWSVDTNTTSGATDGQYYDAGAGVAWDTFSGYPQLFAIAAQSFTAPSITQNPQSQGANLNQTVTFTAAAGGSPTPTVQWQVSTDGGSSFSNIGGATSTSYSITATSANNGSEYRAVFTNTGGSQTTTAATLTVANDATATTAPGGNTTFSPNSQTITLNAVVTDSTEVTPVNSGTVTFTVLNGSTLVGTSVTSATVTNGAASAMYTLPTGTQAGQLTIEAVYNPGAGFNGSSDSSHKLTITKATPTASLAISNSPMTYNGLAQSATVITSTSSTPGSVTNILTGGASAQINAGIYAVTADFVPTDSIDYNSLTVLPAGNFVINKANASVIVTPYTVTYDGSPHTATVASITGVNGETGATVGSVDLTGTIHTNAGIYNDSWSFAGTGNYNSVSAHTIDDTINKANATVAVTPYTVTYDGNPHTATVTSITGVNGETGATVGVVNLSTTHTNAGVYTADFWSLTGSANYNNIASTPITDTINKANATIVVTPYTVTYDGFPQTATIASITGVNGETGATVGVVNLSTTHTNAGVYTADFWSLTGSANYNNIASTPITDTINKANATVIVTPYTVTYDGNPHTATVASIGGVNGETGSTVGTVSLSTTHTNAGVYAADFWSFAGTSNYNSISAQTIRDTINKANATVVVTPYTVTYDGNPHTATVASIIGVNDETGSTVGTVDLTGTTHTNAGIYNDPWSLAGTGNYNDISGQTVIDTINQATANINVTPYSVTYDGNPHTATGVGTGIGGADVSALLDLSGTTHTNAGIYANDTWTFHDPNGNYSDATGTVSDSIGKATPAVDVADSGGVFNGNPFPATATVAGLDGSFGTTLEGVSPIVVYFAGNTATGTPLPGAPIAAGTYSVIAAFSGSGDYSSQRSNPLSFTITPETPLVSVSDAGGTYDSQPFPATATVTDVNGNAASALEGVTPTLAYYSGSTATGAFTATAPTGAGAYTVVASFAGSADYAAADSDPVTFTIAPATPLVGVSDAGGTYNGQPFPATATVTDLNGNTASTLEGVTPTLAYYSGSTTTGSSTATAPTAAGTYTVVASFGGSADYAIAQSGPVTFTIAQAAPTLTISDSGGPYNASPFVATATIQGVEPGAIAGASLEGVTPTITYYNGTSAKGTPLASAPVNVGTYTAVATFAGSSDYLSASASVTFNITTAATVIHTADDGGVYNGNPFPASGYVAGPDGKPFATPVFAYFLASDTHKLHPLGAAPSAPGSYVFTATFAGQGGYLPSVTSAPFVIAKAPTVIHTADGGGAYTGKPYPASGYVAGVGGTPILTPVFSYYLASDIHHQHPLSGVPSAPGNYVFLANFAGNADYLPSVTSAPFTIYIPVTSFTATAIHPKAGVAFDGVVATFNAPAGLPTSDFVVTINWGDGKTSSGVLSATSTTGHYQIVGLHTYAKTGAYTLTIALQPLATAGQTLSTGATVTAK